MELRNLATFLRVAELGNFTHAAEELGYSQSAVTVQIKQLEKELDTQLFERIGRTVRLTDSGGIFRERARETLEAAERARLSVRGAPEETGTIRVGTMESLGASVMSRLIPSFHRTFPLVKAVVLTGRTDGLLDMLRRNDADFIFFIDEKQYAPDWMIPLCRPEPIYLVAPPAHPLVGRKRLSLRDLVTQEFVLTEEGEGYRVPFDRMLQEGSLHVDPILEIGSTEVVLSLVEQGLGLSVLPHYVAGRAIREGRVAVLDVPELRQSMHLQIIYHKNKRRTKRMRGMMDLIIRSVSSGRGGGEDDSP